MSSDESAIENTDNSDSDSPTKKKRLIKHKMSWRSREMQATIDSLDRKIKRRHSGRSKSMCLDVEVSGESTSPKPENGHVNFSADYV